MGLNWLITGGCGFIGTSLARRLFSEGGHSLRVVDNLSVGTRRDLESVCSYSELSREDFENNRAGFGYEGCQLITGDILDRELAELVVGGADVIVHLAANTGVAPSVEDPYMDCVTNVLGTLNYLEAARKSDVRRFVFASSGAPVGEVEPPIHEELAARPVSPYGASKLAGEGYCSAYNRTFNIDTVALRFGNVYGPGSGHKSSVVAKFIRRAMSGEALEIYGDGNQTRDFIFIDDLIDAIYLASTRQNVSGETFQIATSQETTLNELVDIMLPVLDRAGIVKPEITNLTPRLGDVRRNFSDTSKARNRLGWEVQTDLETGLRKTVDWFREQKSAGNGRASA